MVMINGVSWLEGAACAHDADEPLRPLDEVLSDLAAVLPPPEKDRSLMCKDEHPWWQGPLFIPLATSAFWVLFFLGLWAVGWL